MLLNYNLTIKDLVRITANGLETASFVEIRNSLIDRYKEVYGSDIDLSTGTADGVFVNDIALIINNILQTMQLLYSNLNVNTASGIYLDNLCELSNVRRKGATYSNASLQVTNTQDTQSSEFVDLTFVDISGTEWYHPGTVQFDANETKQLQVICKEPGKIEAKAGSIHETLEVSYLDVVQNADANVGADEESDAALRARRLQSSGSAGITVLESLAGALLNISGIDDVKIYNNNTIDATTATDGTSIDPHSIYVVLRQQPGVEIKDELIGSLIHNKLTPGIHSCISTDAVHGTPKNYTYVSKIYDITIADSEQNVYWKVAIPIAPELKINIFTSDYFSESEFDIIGNAIIKYMNNLPLNSVASVSDILLEAINADPLFKGKNTYTVDTSGITINDAQYDTYYNYTTIAHTQVTGTPNKWTITLS